MKAIVHHQYGPPDVLQLEQIPKPTVGDDDVLIKVHAASANAGDWHLMRADPFLVRLMFGGLFQPKFKILGSDVAGVVEAVGKNVKRFQPGDEVFGVLSECGFGAFAEYACAPELALVPKPAGITFEQAAAVPQAALTALQGLRDKGHIRSGHKVLVNGASGGVGSFAVQIAKSFDAEVTGVCSTPNLDMVRQLGADQVIDYTQQDITQNGQRYDLIFDAAAYRSVSDYQRILAPNGIYVMVGGATSRMFQVMLLGPWFSMTTNKKVDFLASKPTHQDLEVLKDLLDRGKITPVIDRRYTLSEVPDAIRYLEKGHARGKVVITV